ncbi:NYN domain-containing protein [Pseudomonas gingeri]|uniref:NYN domain-containing protein n=1 Tax=Pseudomonas gingeri TaxID=117681 RepID=UPI0015A29F4F|nr:NYN domain-containing protein [Pseudomonas gingeri]NWA27277.1 NYN domain-containing protein [Pseudomonas gingeri]NWD69373.1 NYN domain-containing protein [Pseudomonas gingeri]
MKRTAVLIDGGFFFQRTLFFIRKYFRKDFSITAEQLARVIKKIVRLHVEDSRAATRELYRVYYYDCPPPSNQVRLPIAPEGQTSAGHFNFKSHPPYQLRRDLHDHLRSSRKTALRLGELAKNGEWQLNVHTLRDLLRGTRQWAELTNDDFHYKVQQKAVDTKLGMDITTLALDKLVDVIILVAGDSDFVPAAKLARMKGIDFVLDPMWANTSSSLSEHVDGLQSYDLVRIIRDVTGEVVSNIPDWWQKCSDINLQKHYAEMTITRGLGSDTGVFN